MDPVLLCTLNLSEGKREEVIQVVANAIASVRGVKLMSVDRGATVHRSVIAFGGSPEGVFEAARLAYELGLKYIDMRYHQGAHPRIGAIDVCPFTPYRGIDKEWLKAQVEKFAQEIADRHKLPVFLYAESARFPERRKLPAIRKGGYEKLAERLKTPEWTPDFGPLVPHPKGGATVIGVRDFIAAFNLTLNSRSEEVANKIARQVRESNGGLPHVQAMGWFLPEVGFVQVSMNITNLRETPLHKAFETVEEVARQYKVKITDAEIVGILPEYALVEAGRYFLSHTGETTDNLTRRDLVRVAVRSLLLESFRPHDRLAEWVLGPAQEGPDFCEISLREILWQLAGTEGNLQPEVAVGIHAAMALSVAARLSAGLPARHAFVHPEYMQLLQAVLDKLHTTSLDLEALRLIANKILRGFALLRQISDTLSADQKDTVVLLVRLFHNTLEEIAAAYYPYLGSKDRIMEEKHDIELQGRFFEEEIFKKLRVL
ncbi:MAG: glutamate formimidoyltransferase [Bacteroidia bacterium]|nr:glutamate formimidoyltransferase [Bacteroidia bacterium]